MTEDREPPEVIDQPTGDQPGTDVVRLEPPQPTSLTVPGGVDNALKEWEDYQRLTQDLLNESDYQQIGRSKFKKKSAWRKYARAFNISDRVTFEHIERDERGRPLWARIRVVAIAPNGRTAEADQEAHIDEKCCPQAEGEECNPRGRHTHCEGGCSGRIHWSHDGDIPAVALTRAKNRAISDLIGAGEVSSEEMQRSENEERDQPQNATSRPPRPENSTHAARRTNPPQQRTEPAAPPWADELKAKLAAVEGLDLDYVAMAIGVAKATSAEIQKWLDANTDFVHPLDALVAQAVEKMPPELREKVAAKTATGGEPDAVKPADPGPAQDDAPPAEE
ncbi:hypothetical protein LCGC14_0391220 [marine sediment metagenome]|uniref:Uncharacterized protein n=1 Tax=marine sediment metagenome TaxID=412755 RepID=A0A0F9VLH3_9ZZZZ